MFVSSHLDPHFWNFRIWQTLLLINVRVVSVFVTKHWSRIKHGISKHVSNWSSQFIDYSLMNLTKQPGICIKFGGCLGGGGGGNMALYLGPSIRTCWVLHDLIETSACVSLAALPMLSLNTIFESFR